MNEKRTAELKRRDVLQKGVATSAFVAGGIGLTGTVAGKQGQRNCTLNWGKEVTKSACNGQGNPLINVNRKVRNGIEDPPWAHLNFNQKIQVWETNSGGFCAALKYRGNFDTEAFAGEPSPGARFVDGVEGGTLTGEEEGRFEGGFRLTFNGEFKPNGAQTRGSLGTVNQNCGQTTNSCAFRSSIDWIGNYFDGYGESIAFPWFGTIYHGGDCGTLVNSIDGNCGDILCK
jgi:hypothetical protein